MANDIALFNVNDGLTGRDGGPYLDQEEQREAERRRAIVEDREPDYSQKSATAGTQLVTGPQLVLQTANSNHIPSQESVNPLGANLQKIAESDDTPVEVFTVAPTSQFNEDNSATEETEPGTDETQQTPNEPQDTNTEDSNNLDTTDETNETDGSGHPNTDIFK